MRSLIIGENPARGQASAMRVNALLQIAYGLSSDRSDPERRLNDLHVVLGTTVDGVYRPALSFANGDYGLANAVAEGKLDLAAINPSAYLTMAYRGTGPFSSALPLRVIATMPTLVVMLFAVSPKTGLSSLSEIRDRKYPLQLSIRGNLAHGTRFVTDRVLAPLGFSLADIESWGGRLHYIDTPNSPVRMEAIRDGGIDAVFDEGVKGWGVVAMQQGWRFLDLEPPCRSALETLGWAVCPVRPLFPELTEEIMAPSFSGWPLFTRADLPDELGYGMVKAMHGAWDRLAFDSDEPVTLSGVSVSSDAAPRDVPLHPGAERYYREQGCAV